jgi:hypothetical protein
MYSLLMWLNQSPNFESESRKLFFILKLVNQTNLPKRVTADVIRRRISTYVCMYVLTWLKNVPY